MNMNRHNKFMKLSDAILSGGKIDVRRVRRLMRAVYVGEGASFSPGLRFKMVARASVSAKKMQAHREKTISAASRVVLDHIRADWES